MRNIGQSPLHPIVPNPIRLLVRSAVRFRCVPRERQSEQENAIAATASVDSNKFAFVTTVSFRNNSEVVCDVLLEIVSSAVMGGVALYAHLRKSGISNDSEKLNKIFSLTGLNVRDGDKTYTAQLVKKVNYPWGTEYRYRIPLGRSFEDYQAKLPHIQDGLNNRKTMLVVGDNTRITLFTHKPFHEMEREEKIHACYLHASLKYVTKEYMTNASLRQRFGKEDRDISIISRVIRDALNEGKIKPLDPDTAPRYMKYIPFWA
ncbi:hypothetical protein NDK47_23940 [Brevibacillus ruminantium]|uniref:Uncharacterized protein n=1 Tax=Brevibacillus ruminantium TaxID=2950604 RepID=A0ABY4WDJ8_9BACL|nr:hypothetical protein [Brevibacillus ruminantium]USG65137.1 hypothetical protein NDK47_23940 [Brevibacillus ruminantium]